MEVFNHGTGDNRLPIPSVGAEVASLELIRTETVLSRLPVHNLAKKGKVNIQIVKTTPTGEVELKWEVSYSERYGQARQLAYKLDTIVINQRIEEAGRPLPRLLRIGSLNEICAELNLATHAGQNTKDLRRAFLQNASAFITAKFNYRANDNSERRVEAGITRYGVIFTGEKLPDGRRADAVYVAFNDPFWEVLNNAPVRPLDRAYMKELPPASQRFYEIISRKIFATLKNDYPRAKISYSEYCTFSAQLRHHERQRVQDQMAKLLRPHKVSGYITAVKYEPTIDAENQPDWILYVTPGPKAIAEFEAAHERKPRKLATITRPRQQRHPETHDRDSHNKLLEPPVLKFDPTLIAEFTRRGITEKKAMEIVASLAPGRDIAAQLEYADQMIRHAGFKIENPPGFYIRMIERNLPVPDGFETSAKRKMREEREQRERDRRASEDARRDLEDSYESYCSRAVEAYIDTNPATHDAIFQGKLAEERKLYPGGWASLNVSTAKFAAKNEIRRQLNLPTFEEFVAKKQEGNEASQNTDVAPTNELTSTAEVELPEEESLTSGEVAPDRLVERSSPEETAEQPPDISMNPEPAEREISESSANDIAA